MGYLFNYIESVSDTQNIRLIQRENSDFKIKVTSLLAELEQLQKEKEDITTKVDQKERIHVKRYLIFIIQPIRIMNETAVCKQIQAEGEAYKSNVFFKNI